MTPWEAEAWGFALLVYLVGLVVCGVMALRQRRAAVEDVADGGRTGAGGDGDDPGGLQSVGQRTGDRVEDATCESPNDPAIVS